MKKLNHGFTLIELIVSLVSLTFILLITFNVLSNLKNKRESNHIADQVKFFSDTGVKYLSINYRDLVKQAKTNDLVVPYNVFNTFSPKGTKSNTYNGQTSCLYLTAGENNTLRAFLFIGNTSKTQPLLYSQTANIANTIGGNAGILVPDNGGTYKIRGGIENDFKFSQNAITTINNNCGFYNNKVADNSLIIDLTKDNNLFAALQTKTDKLAPDPDEDPSLKKAGISNKLTMRTNLYFDNIVKESSSLANYYCDASQIDSSDANQLCVDYANNNGLNMYSSSALWTNSVLALDGKSCLATATAQFYSIQNNYSCNSGSFPSPGNYCPQTLNGKTIAVNPPPRWETQVSGNQCISKAYARYQTASCRVSCGTDGCSSYINSKINNHGLNCVAGTVNNLAPFIDGTYNSSTQSCHYNVQCWVGPNAVFDAPPQGNVVDSTDTLCTANAVAFPANNSPTRNDITSSCGSQTFDALVTYTGVPAEHSYKALDFGKAPQIGKRIQIKSTAAPGVESRTSQLGIYNAGIQAGYIAPNSHKISLGENCLAQDIGKVAQQQRADIIVSGGQLQCTYNPTFCSGSHYCYLPTKAASIINDYSPSATQGNCPAGTIVDSQYSDTVDKNAVCNYQGYGTLQGITVVGINCYQTQNSLNVCTGYKTVCRYNNAGTINDIPIAALAHLRCSTDTSTYTVDYTPTN